MIRGRFASPARQRLLSDGAWVAGGQVSVALGLLIGTRVLTELLPPAVFGLVTLLIGASTLGATLLCTPLLQALLRFYPDAEVAGTVSGIRRAISVPLRRGTEILVLALLLGGAGYAWWRDQPFVPFLALSGLAIADVARNFETTILSAARRQRTAALWTAADTWARAALSIGAVLILGATTEAVLLGYFAGSVVVLGGARVLVRREGAAPSTEVSDAVLQDFRANVRRYAVPLIPLALVGWVSSLSDRYIVAGLLGLRDAGIYAAAYGLLNRPVGVGSSIFLTTLRPVYFKAVASGDTLKARKIVRIWLSSLGFALAIGVVLTVLLSDLVTRLLLGPQYRATSGLLPWLAAGFSLLALSQVYNTVSLAHKQSWSVSLSELAGALASVAAAIPLTKAYGLRGTAIAVPVYYGAQLLTAWALSKRARSLGEAASVGPAAA